MAPATGFLGLRTLARVGSAAPESVHRAARMWCALAFAMPVIIYLGLRWLGAPTDDRHHSRPRARRSGPRPSASSVRGGSRSNSSAIARAGVFRLCVPRGLGGEEADPATLLAVLEELARADGSTGWCAMIGATSGLMSGYLPEDEARVIYGTSPDVVTGGVFAPTGRAVREDAHYRVTGRWRFASGCQHSDWLMGGCLVQDGEVRRAPAWCSSRRRDAEIIDTWTVSGLRGTGSHDMAVRDLRVPVTRSVSPSDEPPVADGALYAFPLFGLLAVGIAAVALGIARRALDEIVALASGKTPTGGRRPLAERSTVQAQIAEAEATRASAQAFLREVVDAAWTEARRPAAASTSRRARDCGWRPRTPPRRRRAQSTRPTPWRRDRDLRRPPAAARVPRRPRRDPAHDGRPADVGTGRPRSARARDRHLAALTRPIERSSRDHRHRDTQGEVRPGGRSHRRYAQDDRPRAGQRAGHDHLRAEPVQRGPDHVRGVRGVRRPGRLRDARREPSRCWSSSAWPAASSTGGPTSPCTKRSPASADGATSSSTSRARTSLASRSTGPSA